MTATLNIEAPVRGAEDDGLDRILGDGALFMINEACPKLKISRPSMYRGMANGSIPFVWIGTRRALTRSVMKRLMRNGVGPFSRGKKTS
jgi:hypothetical protein